MDGWYVRVNTSRILGSATSGIDCRQKKEKGSLPSTPVNQLQCLIDRIRSGNKKGRRYAGIQNLVTGFFENVQ